MPQVTYCAFGCSKVSLVLYFAHLVFHHHVTRREALAILAAL